MKKFGLTLITVLTFIMLFSTMQAEATSFAQIIRDTEAVYYLDVDSVQLRSGNGSEYVVGWIKYIPRGAALRGYNNISRRLGKNKVDSLMLLYAINPNVRQLQEISSVIHDVHGGVLETSENGFSSYSYKEVVPSSYGEVIYDAILNCYNKKKEN
jgi:hypothetical protein